MASETGNVKWSNHALERMEQRGIFATDALRILRTGDLKGDPEMARQGEWKCKLVKRLRGGRFGGVVVITLRSDKLLVKTVEWEDQV